MKKNEKIMILILLVILIVAVIIFATNRNTSEEDTNVVDENNTIEEFVEVLEDGTKLNTSEKLNEDKEAEGLVFENIQLTQKDGQTVLLADVTNTGSTATETTLFDIILLDKEGNEIVTVGGIMQPLEAGEQAQFNTSMTLDYANAYDFKVIIK